MTLALILKIIAGLGGVTGVTNLAASLVKSLSKGGWKTVLGKAGAAAGGAALASSFGFNPFEADPTGAVTATGVTAMGGASAVSAEMAYELWKRMRGGK